MASSPQDLDTIKQRQQVMWATGDFAEIGTRLLITSELLCESAEFPAGDTVLDVACGNGNTALAAARRFGEVTGIDYVPELLNRARERAAAERLSIDFREGDAEALAFPDAAFGVVLSTFGVMFAPNHEKAASEMLRVCRSGGKIGMANWTPEGGVGQLFRTVARFVSPAPNVQPPPLWGTEEHVQALLGDGARDLTFTRRHFMMRYLSAEHWLGFHRANFGPIVTAYAGQDDSGQQQLTHALLGWAEDANRSTDGTFVAPCEYLEVVATRN